MSFKGSHVENAHMPRLFVALGALLVRKYHVPCSVVQQHPLNLCFSLEHRLGSRLQRRASGCVVICLSVGLVTEFLPQRNMKPN